MDTSTVIEKVIRARDKKNVLRTQRIANSYLNGVERIPEVMWEKARNLGKISGETPREIVISAAVDKKVAYHLSKKGSRQGLAEIAQIGRLRRAGVSVAKLPSVGLGSVKLLAGELVSGSCKEAAATKSIDGIINGREFVCFKYVKQAGGSQDNQIRDASYFLMNADLYVNTHKKDDVRFVVIVDGPYGESKIDYLREFCSSDRVRVFSTDTYEDFKD